MLMNPNGFAITCLSFLQTLLQTEILKNQLQIANNLKSTVATSSPGSHHSQLLASINNSPASNTNTSTTSNLGQFCYAVALTQLVLMLVTLIFCFTIGTSSSPQFSFDSVCGISSSPQLSPTPTLNSGLTSLGQEKVG